MAGAGGRASRAGRGGFALGVAICIVAAILWGGTGVAGQYLVTMRGVDNAWITTFRTLVGGAILVGLSIVRERGQAFDIWRNRRDAVHVLIYGAIGVAACLWTYLEAVSRSNAPTATVLQYLSPIMIVGFVAVRTRTAPSAREVAGVVCAVAGVFIMATHLDPGSLAVSPAALIFGTISAGCLAFYGLFPRELLKRYSAPCLYGWAVLAAGVMMSFVHPLWDVPAAVADGLDLPLAAVLAYTTLAGTVIAYTIYLVGVRLVGAARGSMISSVEPVATALIAAVLLGTPVGIYEWIGTALITVTVVLCALPAKPRRRAGDPVQASGAK